MRYTGPHSGWPASERLSANAGSAARAARAADPAFALSRTEAGHPQWGPIYRKVVP